MKELDQFTVEQLEKYAKPEALTFPPSHAQVAALARIALGLKKAIPVRVDFECEGCGFAYANDPVSACDCGSKSFKQVDVYHQPLPSDGTPVGWVAFSDRLPNLDERVLLYFGTYDGHIEDGFIGDEGDGIYHYFFDGDSLTSMPTHWMPLPAAPKPEK